MRLPRTSLLARLTGPSAPAAAILEAPTGYGKSWLLHKLWKPPMLRRRGTLGEIDDADIAAAGTLIVDDAHLLSDVDIDRLVDLIEFSNGAFRVYVAGRLVADRLYEAVELVDGLILGAKALSITPEEIVDQMPAFGAATAQQVVDITDGSVRTIAAALTSAQRESLDGTVSYAGRIVNANTQTTIEHLEPPHVAMVGLLARSPGVDRLVLDKLAGPGSVHLLLASGVPLRRHGPGGLELATAASFRVIPVEFSAAQRFARELVERGRAVDAITLLLDAGDHAEAARLVAGLSESAVDTVEPRAMLNLLARLGTVVDSEPAMLLVRASVLRELGRYDAAMADIERAATQKNDLGPALRRRVEVEWARAQFTAGHRDAAVRAAEIALVDIGAGEERTYARAHEVLAECQVSVGGRTELQRAAESYRVAAAAWEACGEFARARSCRTALATSVMKLLGRFDQALDELAEILSSPDLSEPERAWTLLMEGFVLCDAGRLDSAEERFRTCVGAGLTGDNPRLVAAAAWGQMVVASRRGDLAGTLRCIAEAENTALDEGDDLFGVLFQCDVAEALGALGELDQAELYVQRASARAELYPEEVSLARFVLDARRGRLGDVEAQLEKTVPFKRWLVLLVSSHAAARSGDLVTAQQMLADSDRELTALGFASAVPLGEQREQDAARALLQRGSVVPSREEKAPSLPTLNADERRLSVIGSPMAVRLGSDTVPIPPGNPQRLVGVVVARGGVASLDQIGEALWPEDESGAARTRLRNVLLRLRRAVGDVVVRSDTRVRLAPGVVCDLHEFDRIASDATLSARADPDLAGQLAERAVEIGSGSVFADFEYEEWAITTRRAAEQQMISLLDLLSIQAEDAGDLPRAQALAERALALDRYADSRYVRLAELLTMQDRVASAIAVLDEANNMARELGEHAPGPRVAERRAEILRRASGGA